MKPPPTLFGIPIAAAATRDWLWKSTVWRNRLEFILEDWGPKVREELIRPRPLDELRPGGLGTFFIYSFMDKCSYDPNFKEGNRLKLVKFLTQKGSLLQ